MVIVYTVVSQLHLLKSRRKEFLLQEAKEKLTTIFLKIRVVPMIQVMQNIRVEIVIEENQIPYHKVQSGNFQVDRHRQVVNLRNITKNNI